MASIARTDIHRPSAPEFDPEAYVLLGVFDTAPEAGQGRARTAVIAGQRAQSRDFAAHVGQRHVCGHCGAALRYVALMVRQDVGEMIYVGQDCLSNRFEDLTKGEFDALRKAAALNRDRAKLADKRAAFIAANPSVAELLDADEAGETFGFLIDIARKFRQYGELSPRQVEVSARVLGEARAKAAAREAERVAKEAAKASGTIAPAPTGKTVITGEVVSEPRFVSNPHGPGGSVKARIREDRGFTVWVTIPLAIEDQVEKGTRVTMTATLKPSDDDAHHAWGSRPTKAAVAA